MYAQQQQQQLRSGHSHKLAAYCRSSLSKMQFGTTHPTALATRLQARSQTKKILRGGAKVTSHCTQLTLQSLTAPLLWKWGIKPCCDKCDILGVLSRKWSQKNFQMKLLGARRQFGGNCRPCPFWLCHCTGASCNSNQMTPSQVQFGGNCPPPRRVHSGYVTVQECPAIASKWLQILGVADTSLSPMHKRWSCSHAETFSWHGSSQSAAAAAACCFLPETN